MNRTRKRYTQARPGKSKDNPGFLPQVTLTPYLERLCREQSDRIFMSILGGMNIVARQAFYRYTRPKPKVRNSKTGLKK